MTNAILAELPLKAVTAGVRLNAAGSFQGDLYLQGNSANRIADLLSGTQPSRTALYLDRDGTLLWGGIIWVRGPYWASAPKLTLAGTDFFGYFFRRFLTATKTYAAADQLFIVRDLVNWAQAASGGNIGIIVGAEVSGRLVSRTYNSYDLKKIGDAIVELSAVAGGFDFAVDVAYNSSGLPTKTLRLSYPRRGQGQGMTGWVFDFPGNIIDYGWPEDGTTQATAIMATGAGAGAAQLLSTANRADLIAAGYPLLEAVVPYKDVTVQATLDDRASSDVNARAQVVTIPEITVRADMDPILGSYTQGDDCQIQITDALRFPAGLSLLQRIVGYDITPPDAGQAESVPLILGPPSQDTIIHPQTLGSLLQNVDKRLQIIEGQAP
jgi:hypothetical protein